MNNRATQELELHSTFLNPNINILVIFISTAEKANKINPIFTIITPLLF